MEERFYSDIERQIVCSQDFMASMPAPCLLYTKDGRIAWCNKPMLNLFWGTLAVPKYRPHSDIWGAKCEDVMPDYLWPYVLEQNERVFKTKSPQYEEWSDEVWVGVRWKCLRFWVDDDHVGVILFPLDESHLAVCAEALRAKEDEGGNDSDMA